MKEWGPVGTAQVGDLPCVASVGVRDKKLHGSGFHHALRKERGVFVHLLLRLGARCPPDQLLTIRRKERPSVVAKLVGDLLDIAAVQCAGVQVQIAMACAREHHAVAFGTHGGFGIVRRAGGDGGDLSRIQVLENQVVAVVNGPDVAPFRAPIRHLRTRQVGALGGGVHHHGVARQEIRAGGSSLSAADPSGGGCSVGRAICIQGHLPNLVARNARLGLRGLVNEGIPSKGPISFRIVSPKRELPHIGQMNLLRRRFIGRRFFLRLRSGRFTTGHRDQEAHSTRFCPQLFHAAKLTDACRSDVVILSHG